MTILFEDAQLLVCVKPAGILSQAAQNGGESMITLLEAHTGGAVFPVHRLDRAVGGVMVYAKTKEAAAALSKQVADRAMQKAYRALVHGVIEPPAGVMEDLLFKDSRTNKVFVVKRERKGVKPARLSYETLEVREPSADDRSCPLSFAALSSAPDPFHHGLRPRSPFPKGDDRGASRGITVACFDSIRYGPYPSDSRPVCVAETPAGRRRAVRGEGRRKRASSLVVPPDVFPPENGGGDDVHAGGAVLTENLKFEK